MSLFDHGSVHISAKTDYAIRATIELTQLRPTGPLTAHAIAEAQRIPLRFLLNILADLRRDGLVDSRRGPGGGWWLARPAELISVAEVIRAVDGPLTTLTAVRHGAPTSDTVTTSLNQMWGAVRQGIRDVLERITVADLASGELPGPILRTSGAC